MPKTALQRHKGRMSYSQIPKRKKLGISMVPPLSTKGRALIQAVPAQVPATLSPELVGLSAVSVEQVDSTVQISVSRTSLVHLGELDGAEGHDSSLSRKRSWSEKTSKFKRTSVS